MRRSIIRHISLLLLLTGYVVARPVPPAIPKAAQWQRYELTFTSAKHYENPYTDVEMWVDFNNDKGEKLVRPAFWDGENQWKVRFAPPDANRIWTWQTHTSVDDSGLNNKTGQLASVPYRGKNALLKHGLLRMSAGKRNVVQADGTPFLVVGDTPWALPFRATTEQARVYAHDRQQKGFNTALLITLQPDRNAEGPEARNTPLGFDRAFEDLPNGQITRLKPDYFQMLDSLVGILLAHEIVPLYAPFAHGYGWKGKVPIGPKVTPEQYIRYCKYLVARYGSTPALWLISLDNNGKSPGVKPSGLAIEKWDAYQQPVGIHYNPHDNSLAGWAKGDSSCCFHHNRVYQDEPWLDFQWAQTGHDGKHIYYKVDEMYDHTPTKANMNGESTYEGMGEGKLGLGWWQGQDAWNQLMHGGTMGVVYGAACLWQWKITPDEAGWEAWTDAPYSWKEAMNLEGSRYVGAISRAFAGYNFTDMQRRRDLTTTPKMPILAKEGIFYMVFLDEPDSIQFTKLPVGLTYRWFNPVAGTFAGNGRTKGNDTFKKPNKAPWVLVIGNRKP